MAFREADPVGLGLIGCSSVGVFCMHQFRDMAQVRAVAVADPDPRAAKAAARRLEMKAAESPEALVAREDVDIVHVAGPPCVHYETAVKALESGKHVLLDQPPAMTLEEARALVEAADKAERVLACNLLLRYHPLSPIVKRLIDENLLGEPLHGFFENDGSDETYPPDHWFWDRRQSGGVFIERATHMFDLIGWWLGPGRVAAAQHRRRPGSDIVEHVHCSMLYRDGVLVDFYHGFHQPARLDRQETRLVFERGRLSIDDWMPTRLEIEALVDEASLRGIQKAMPGLAVQTIEGYTGRLKQRKSRHKSYEVDRYVTITYDLGLPKSTLSGNIMRRVMNDLLSAVHDPEHARRATADDALAALATAAEADRLAHEAEEASP